MNSRERVLAALNHQPPDKVPLDIGGHRSSGIAAIAYARLKQELAITTGDIYVYDMVQQLAIVEEPVLDALGVDVIEMGRGFLKDDSDWKDWVLPDGTPCKIPDYINVEKREEDWWLLTDDGQELGLQKKGCLYFEQTYFPMRDRDITTDDFSNLEYDMGRTIWTGTPHPGAHLPLNEAGLKEMSIKAKVLRESTDRAIVALFGGNMFELPQWLYGMENYFVYMGLYPEDVIRLSEKICEIHMKNLEKWIGAVGPYVDVVLFGDDLGSQNSPLMSTRMYRDYFKPYHKKLWNRAKELAEVKTMLHCCGSITPLIPDLIEAGIDAINPVQINCAGMDASELKAKFANEITFWGGGCDTGDILPNASSEEIRQHVIRQVDVLNRNGGFVFQQVHNIMANVPASNVVTMCKAIRN